MSRIATATILTIKCVIEKSLKVDGCMKSLDVVFYLQLNRLAEAIEDCSSAVKLDDTYLKAYMRRAKW